MDDPVLLAVQRFMDAVETRLTEHDTEIRGALTELRGVLTEIQTRAASLPTEGPPGKDGKDGKNGRDGVDGKSGEKGERGADGVATLEQIEAIVEKRFADVQVRNLADTYQGVYKPGETYTRGVLTTWGGSLWLALAETTKKPGETPDWRLVVKK